MSDQVVTNETQHPTSGFRSFDEISTDVVLSVSFNGTGTRFATASADHRLRIYDLDAENQYTSVDQWRAHDAEVTEVNWAQFQIDDLIF